MPKKTLNQTHPQFIENWSKDNDFKMTDVTHRSGKTAKWQCPVKDCHIFSREIRKYVKNKNCPICISRLICPTDQCNSLQYKCSEEIKNQWNEEKNGPMTKYFPRLN